MFNENSGLVLVWVRLINLGTYTIDQVPNLSNLKEMVQTVLNKNKGEWKLWYSQKILV